MNEKGKFIRVLGYAGVYFSAVVGAGYASGQEIMQFFSNFGTGSLLAVIPVTILFMFLGWVAIDLGHGMQTDSHGPIIRATCGKWIGTVVDWVISFFMFGCFALMISGGGTTLSDYFGLNPVLGRILVALITALVVTFGFHSISFFNGIIGPIIIISILAVGIIALVTSGGNISEADRILETADVYRSSPNIVISLFIYVAYCVTPNIATLAGIGKQEKDGKVRMLAGIFGGLALGVCILLIDYVLLRNYGEIYQSSIPLVEMAIRISRPLGIFFAVILVLGILTSAVSFLFGTITRFTEYGTKKSKIFTVIVTVVSLLIGLVPFDRLVNTFYPLLGYVGIIVMIGFVVYVIRHRNADNIDKNP